MQQFSYLEFEASVPAAEKTDWLWRVEPYRLARFLIPQARDDARTLYAHPLGRPLMSQLWRATGSISANIAEGYSRGTGPDRARFYEYALGSTRECIVWYEATREILNKEVVDERVGQLAHIKRLILSVLPSTRRTSVRN